MQRVPTKTGMTRIAHNNKPDVHSELELYALVEKTPLGLSFTVSGPRYLGMLMWQSAL